ncbi:hypothetical protein [Streptomonospora litoralis]|uniref:Uncharacterized protein n=1 Tax=Streptomonospora litoralis TaxID=2498135 RepID=A0A4P6PYF1_9ACTN|nr:hypothetical protein [Streptomonospora litoralis]QBI53153.1 hypothetical protein EKD16_06780 [Streptomonospora litoralis]
MSKKRTKKGKQRGGAQLSGNPQRRAEQLAEREARRPAPEDALWAHEPPVPDWQGMFPGLVDDGGPFQGWVESHEDVLDRVRKLEIPESPLSIDSTTCELVGGVYADALLKADEEFYERLEAGEIGDFDSLGDIAGFDPSRPAGWLVELAEAAAREITDHPKDVVAWQGPWLLLRGMAAWSNSGPGEEPGPFEAVGEAFSSAGAALAEEGCISEAPSPDSDLRPHPTAWPRVLHDAYGSRTALLAPFGYGVEQRDPHWYCWDIDNCCIGDVAGAGVFASAEDAAAEWRRAVGDSAPTAAEPRPCTAEEAAELLVIPWSAQLVSGMRIGTEHRELLVEQFRLASRAELVIGHFREQLSHEPEPRTEGVVEDFRRWYAERNGAEPDLDDASTLADEWGPPHCTPPLLYSCSPHRIRQAAVIIADSYQPEYVPGILALMPEWVDWCIERSGVVGEPAEAARAAARDVVREAQHGVPEWDPPFRYREL